MDRPEVNAKITRVTGPFCVEATIPTPLDEDEGDAAAAEDVTPSTDRLLEVLRQNPVLQLGGNRTITLANVRPPAEVAVALGRGGAQARRQPVAFVFGPENGAVSERLVYEAAREAHARSYEQLIVIGFAIEAAARELVEKCERPGRHPGDLRPGDARPGHGRPAEDDAVQPDLQRLRPARRRGHDGAS